MTDNRRGTSILRSFGYAFEGLVHAVRRDRNMRVHLALAFLVLVGSLFVNLTRLELVAIAASIALVLMAEMINSAIESVVDIITDQFDPRAKAAKDLAAGSVLVAAVNALIVAYLVFADEVATFSFDLLLLIRRSPTHLTLVSLVVVVLVVIDGEILHLGQRALQQYAQGSQGSRADLKARNRGGVSARSAHYAAESR
jgi:diacylglycerol kinase (ATP)